ncbi:MAG: 1-acyl-sn-glycerol-3-phosphate acyltransferase [Moraxellaceae bacterium]|nr:1-acyl-sn-glycerol-3-phosphate acyltransferase [Moraxellaceae bacterium]
MKKKSFSSKLFKKLHNKNHQVGEVASFATASSMIFLSSAVRGIPLWLVGSYHKLSNNKQADEFIIKTAKNWIDYNNNLIDTILPKIDWRINLPDDLDPNKKYLLICNHQSWVDTSVIQYISHHPDLKPNLPLTRFFTKYNLIYIPFVGQAFYFLDFPMMKRFSQAQIAKNPQLKNSNLLEAKRACQLLKDKPFVLLNYLEGTRFSKAKHAYHKSPYKHLLKPKAGGISLAISALGDEIDGILDMTIVYPEFQDKPPKYQHLWRGDITQIGVDIRHLQMPETLFNDIKAGGYHNDEQTKKTMYAWLDKLWQEKDKRIEEMLAEF